MAAEAGQDRGSLRTGGKYRRHCPSDRAAPRRRVWATIRGRESPSGGRCDRGRSGRPFLCRRTHAADGNPVANRNHSADDQDGLRPGQRLCSHQRHWDQSVRVGRPSSHTGEYACRIRRLCPRPPRQTDLCGAGIWRHESPLDGVVSQTRGARDDPCELQGRRGAIDRRHRRSRSHLFRDFVGGHVAGKQRSHSPACGVEREARPANPERSHLRRVRISGL